MSDARDEAWEKINALVERRDEQDRRKLVDERRAQRFLDAEARQATQTRYDDVLREYGERAPAPVADEAPMDYQFRLMKTVKGKLARADERPVRSGATTQVGQLARLKLSDLSDNLLQTLEPDLISAARVQADVPHFDTLPPAGQFVERARTDHKTGERKVEFYGRESFIRSMGTAGRRVARLIAGDKVIWGPPFPRTPGS